MLSPTPPQPVRLDDYRQELVLSLSAARECAVSNIQKAQGRYKWAYDKGATNHEYKVGQWVLIRFPQEESGRNRKLSRPKHGPYRVVSVSSPNVVAIKVYFPDETRIQVHMSRVYACPTEFPGGFYWYGGHRAGPGRPPKWVNNILMSADCVPLEESGKTAPEIVPEVAEPQMPSSVDLNRKEDPQAVTPCKSTPISRQTSEDSNPTVVIPRKTRTRTITPPQRLMQCTCATRDDLI